MREHVFSSWAQQLFSDAEMRNHFVSRLIVYRYEYMSESVLLYYYITIYIYFSRIMTLKLSLLSLSRSNNLKVAEYTRPNTYALYYLIPTAYM